MKYFYNWIYHLTVLPQLVILAWLIHGKINQSCWTTFGSWSLMPKLKTVLWHSSLESQIFLLYTIRAWLGVQWLENVKNLQLHYKFSSWSRKYTCVWSNWWLLNSVLLRRGELLFTCLLIIWAEIPIAPTACGTAFPLVLPDIMPPWVPARAIGHWKLDFVAVVLSFGSSRDKGFRHVICFSPVHPGAAVLTTGEPKEVGAVGADTSAAERREGMEGGEWRKMVVNNWCEQMVDYQQNSMLCQLTWKGLSCQTWRIDRSDMHFSFHWWSYLGK